MRVRQLPRHRARVEVVDGEGVRMTTAAMATSPQSSKTGTARRRRTLQASGFIWIAPALLLSAGLVYLCIAYTLYVSTLDWNGVDPNPVNVGLGNYLQLLQDPIFWLALQHTVIFFVVSFGVQTVLGLLFAVLLHSNVRLPWVYKVIIFVPVMLAPAIMAPVFRNLFASDGPFNQILLAVGLGSLAQLWLAQSSTAIFVLIVMNIWQSTGFAFLLYYSAMGQIEPEIIEAARIDGAGNLRVLWHVIVPGVRGTMLALATLAVIGTLKLFDIPYLVTLGGPNYATEFLGTFIYRQTVPLGYVGYGAALSIALLVLALTLSVILNLRAQRDKKSRHIIEVTGVGMEGK